MILLLSDIHRIDLCAEGRALPGRGWKGLSLVLFDVHGKGNTHPDFLLDDGTAIGIDARSVVWDYCQGLNAPDHEANRGYRNVDAELASIVRGIQDRQDIYDCIMRYCRGLDRFDRDVVASAYHPGAIDDHGHFVGPAEEFIDSAIAVHTKMHPRTMHHITNHMCEIQGDTAHAESYYIFHSLNAEAPWHSMCSGRYIDRLEKRDGRWGIVARICTVDIFADDWDPNGDILDGSHVATSKTKGDPSYRRPLVVDPARFTV